MVGIYSVCLTAVRWATEIVRKGSHTISHVYPPNNEGVFSQRTSPLAFWAIENLIRVCGPPTQDQYQCYSKRNFQSDTIQYTIRKVANSETFFHQLAVLVHSIYSTVRSHATLPARNNQNNLPNSQRVLHSTNQGNRFWKPTSINHRI